MWLAFEDFTNRNEKAPEGMRDDIGANGGFPNIVINYLALNFCF